MGTVEQEDAVRFPWSKRIEESSPEPALEVEAPALRPTPPPSVTKPVRVEFLRALVKLLPYSMTFGQQATLEREREFIEYVRGIIDDWCDDPFILQTVWGEIDDVRAYVEKRVGEVASATAPFDSDELGTIIEARIEQIPSVDLAALREKLDVLAETAVQHRERLAALEGPLGMTDAERELTATFEQHEAERIDEATAEVVVTPTMAADLAAPAQTKAEVWKDGKPCCGSRGPRHMKGCPTLAAPETCPPHRWVIDPLSGSENVGGTCKHCGERREDFAPTVEGQRAPFVVGMNVPCENCGHHKSSAAHRDACGAAA